MQSSPAPDVKACNAKGQSIEDLAAAAMTLQSDAASSSSGELSDQHGRQPKRARLAERDQDAASELDDESEWQARLREESGAELRGADEDEWDRSASEAKIGLFCITTAPCPAECLLQICCAAQRAVMKSQVPN